MLILLTLLTMLTLLTLLTTLTLLTLLTLLMLLTLHTLSIDIVVLIWNTNLDGFRGYVQSQKPYLPTYPISNTGLRDASASKNVHWPQWRCPHSWPLDFSTLLFSVVLHRPALQTVKVAMPLFLKFDCILYPSWKTHSHFAWYPLEIVVCGSCCYQRVMIRNSELDKDKK